MTMDNDNTDEVCDFLANYDKLKMEAKRKEFLKLFHANKKVDNVYARMTRASVYGIAYISECGMHIEIHRDNRRTYDVWTSEKFCHPYMSESFGLTSTQVAEFIMKYPIKHLTNLK